MIGHPMVVLCDNTNDTHLAKALYSALTAAHGSTIQVFMYHSQSESLAVLLPTPGPSVAQATRQWVNSWWSDADTGQYESPARYLALFGIIIPEDEWAGWSTSCPYCGSRDVLDIVSGGFHATGIALTTDGFCVGEAKTFDTQDIRVQCAACQQVFPLDAVAL